VAKLSNEGTQLLYATYLGGSGTDIGKGIAVDSTSSMYLTGATASPDFPTKQPLQPRLGGGEDVFVTKLTAAGDALVYSTYLGGQDRNDFGDSGNSIAVDALGNAYVAGSTASSNFPTKHPLQSTFGGGDEDAFVAKLTVTGDALVYSTYLGGSEIDAVLRMALAPSGDVYVAGWTTSVNFPTVHPLQRVKAGGFSDIFVAKITETASPAQ
jgi:hypothetical protein